MNRLATLSTLLVFGLFSCKTKAQIASQSFIDTNVDSLEYLIYYPKDYKSTSAEKYPLLLFLHGGGQSGSDINKVRQHGIPNLIENGKEFPFIVLAPQNPHLNKYWEEAPVMALLEKVIKEENVDADRIYLTGYSRGAFGAWSLAMQYHHVFAAIFPVSGAVPASYAIWMEKIPIWIFHGEDDPIISIKESEGIVSKLKELGHEPRFTRYPNTKHNAWDSAYATTELYEWMLSQKKK